MPYRILVKGLGNTKHLDIKQNNVQDDDVVHVNEMINKINLCGGLLEYFTEYYTSSSNSSMHNIRIMIILFDKMVSLLLSNL